jgi:hypothetical protein
MKIRGARGPVYLPHAVVVFGPELCPPSEDLPPFAPSQSLDVRTSRRYLSMLVSLTLKKEVKQAST